MNNDIVLRLIEDAAKTLQSKLDLSSKQLTSLPPEIGKLTNLKELDLSCNQLTSLPPEIAKLTNLTKLNLENNPLESPPPEIVKYGIKAIFEYLFKLQTKTIFYNEAKLILVGDGNTGKTTLARRLVCDKYIQNKITQGIDILKWIISAPTPEREEIRLNIWNLGGQEIYHATHQFFLTKRSIYLLVWNARRSRDHESISYWLNTIETFGEDSPIILVMSKLNERDDNDLNIKYLKEKFPQIVGLYKVDSIDGKGIAELKNVIRQAAWNLPHIRTPWAESWFKVRDRLEQDRRDWIDYHEFNQICISEGLDKIQMYVLDELLHDLGIIIHFKDRLGLRNMVILKPEWMVKAFYKILDTQSVYHRGGILLHSELEQIWNPDIYPPDIYPKLLELMNKFELVYELPDRKSHLVAEFLPHIEPEFEWNNTDNLRFNYQYNFLPAGVMTRFIVRVYHDLEKNPDGMYLCWREGAMLRWEDNRAFVKIRPDERRIEIKVYGRKKQELLARIRYEFDHINKSIKKINIEELIPCNCSIECRTQYSYKSLLIFQNKGIETIRCIGSGKDVKLSLLLDDYPIETSPIEIVNIGRSAIIDYSESLEGENRTLNEVKVLLIGEGGAGKTSLLKRVVGEDFDENEPETDGINIKYWEVKNGINKIKVNFWDFGGQEIMHATHQFFLSKRSLYVLVLDARKDEKTEYWLKLVESFSGNSPILVVLNKTDQNPSFDVNRKFLKNKFPFIKGFYPISCKKNEGIENFTLILNKELSKIGHLQTIWAKNWFNVKTQLENMTGNFISYDQYQELCINEDIIDKSAQETLVEFMNDLGVILHFKDFALLDTYVLEPKWVTEAVYKIINSKILAEHKGILRLNLLNEILKSENEIDCYPCEKYKYIIELMKKFELCYEIDAQTVLLPGLLEIQEPKFDFDFTASLRFLVEYNVLPKSIMPRFIVKRHKDIKNKLQWRTGVVLEDKTFHSTAVIKVDENDKKIYIYVRGEQKRDYFSIIRKTFREINDSFEKLEFKELVPLPDNEEIAIEYEELIGLEKMGKEFVTIGKLRKDYQVKLLLDGIEDEIERMKNTDLDRPGIAIYAKEVNMRDKYDVRGAIAVGPGAHAHDVIFNQIWNENKGDIDLPALAAELSKLRLKLKDEATEAEHYSSMGAIASAESCAKKGDGPKTLEYLSKAGKWALDVATTIGVPVATEALKKVIGL